MSEITDKAYAKVKEKRAKAKEIAELLEKRKTWMVPQSCEITDRMHLEDEALEHYWLELKREAEEIESALLCGSEDGDLKSHNEWEIYNACVGLIEECAEQMKEYFDMIGFEPPSEDEIPLLQFSQREIVNRLFLWCTDHSGGTSTDAKCRQLGLEKPYKVLEFECFGSEDEDD